MIEEMKSIKAQLINCVQEQIHDLKTVNTHQLGQVIDMIKDLSEAIYYCTTAKAMTDEVWNKKDSTTEHKEVINGSK